MQVQRVESSKTAPTFEGKVGKSVYKYIRNTVSNAMDSVIETANKSLKPVDKKELSRIKQLGDEITGKLEKYMADTHHATTLEMEKYTDNPHLHFKNSIAKGDGMNFYSYVFSPKGQERDLYQLNRAAEDLLDNYGNKYFDKKFLVYMEVNVRKLAENATNFFKKLWTGINANFTMEFADEIGMPISDDVKNFEKLIDGAAEKRRTRKNFEKSINATIKSNRAAKKEILA